MSIETIIKRRINQAFIAFQAEHGRSLNFYESWTYEGDGFTVQLNGRSHLATGNATYTGPEGIWFCGHNRQDTKPWGTPRRDAKATDRAQASVPTPEGTPIAYRTQEDRYAIARYGTAEILATNLSEQDLYVWVIQHGGTIWGKREDLTWGEYAELSLPSPHL